MTSRRAFLAGLAAATWPSLTWADIGNPAFLAAGKQGQGFVLHGLSDLGASLFQIPLPARGHAAAAHPTRPLAVAFARRPGQFAFVIDCATGAVLHRLAPAANRQFNGHGAFSSDGSLLMTSEVVAEGSAGRIGLWETRHFQRIAEWDSGGIGPHDIKRLPDGRIVVANGGIQTDPLDRSKLNLGQMRPNLSLLSANGTLLDQAELPPEYRANSIRHLALLPGQIAFAMQWEGDKADAVPLVGLWSPGSLPRLCPAAPTEAHVMQGYAGSIAALADGSRLAVTSAPGGAVMLFDGSGTPIATHFRADLSGVAALGPAFTVSDGLGAVWACADSGLSLRQRHRVAWDNHLIALI
ncbi:DUF1513 domain-containing protein [Pseudorhodobacter sp.]|uniref:DUF1513 domain-containing protein n=1 Tax=Pseudorhodobacter sp. TaxID=1934400 RepID=UPI0039E2BDCD